MKHKSIKRIIALMLMAALVLASFAACSGEGGEDGKDVNAGADDTGDNGAVDDSGERAMGRFLEEEIDTAIAFDNIFDMKKMEDGTLFLIGSNGDDGTKSAWTSKDNGTNWEKVYDFPQEVQSSDDGYTDEAVLSSDGQAVCVFDKILEGEGILPELYLIDKEGNGSRIPFELPQREDGEAQNLVMNLCFLGSDQVLVQDVNDNVYQINTADGSVKETYEFDGSVGTHQIYTVGNKMMVLTDTEALLYDTETAEQLSPEEALQKSIAESGIVQAVDTTDAGESMYYLTSGGLYHHKFGGSMTEQMIDGKMNSLGAPAFYPIALMILDEQNILVAANDENSSSPTGISLLKYTYSADTPSKPDKELKVYSLYENRDLSQCISRFQKEHTDVYVNYQAALSEESGVTVSDALKTLTTEIMAGKGPDLIVLDGMPVETYIEKGILKDLSSLTTDAEGSYFENILNTYQDNQGQICAVPARFTIPMIQAGSAYYTPGEDFDSFTQKNALAGMAPETVVTKFWYTCGAAWRKEGGTLDDAKITEFLTKLKNAYGEYDENSDDVNTGMVIGEDGENGNHALQEIERTAFTYGEFDLAFGRANVCIGLAGSFEYGMMNAVNEKLENGDYGLMPGQAEHVFVPEMVLGISSKSSQPETAEEFVKFLLSAEGQNINQRGGFPVERGAFKSLIDGHEYEGMTSMIEGGGVSLEESLSYEMSPTPQEAIDKMTKLAESLATPAFCDDVIREAVVEQGTKVLKGEMQPEEATNAIMQSVNIYLAE